MRSCLIILFSFCSAVSLQAADAGALTFEKDIRPIFRAHCFDCHGATEELEGGLDLRLVRFLEKGGDSGAAIVRGNAEQSYLLERIVSGEMPPGDARVPEHEVAILKQWLEQGANTARPEPESIGPGLGVTQEERSFWSFQPIRRPEVPAAVEGESVQNPIDLLTLKKYPNAQFGDQAGRRVLVLRAYFDLVGLPPSLEDLNRWMADTGDDWYDRLLDELLASPHYGEQWGRHWLDVAGYADSEGFTVADANRPWAWKYRDWVVRSLNKDMPFDQFITEQLAGDELAGPRNGDLTSEQIDLLTATGFLRMAADGTGSGANTPEGRNQVMTDTLKIIGTSLLGLSLQCAQCHDHRYDPIPQSDYFAIRAIFEPALDWKAWKTPPQRLVSLYTAADREQAAAIEKEVQTVAAEKSTKQQEYMKKALEQELMKFEEPLRTELRTAQETPDKERTEEQKKLLDSHPSVKITPGVLYQYLPDAAEDLKTYDKKIGEIRSRKPPEEFLRVLSEPAGHLPETKLFYRGDHNQPKETIAPAALTVTSPQGEVPQFPINDEAVPTSGRRLSFAKWLASRDNPLFARVIVNRVWMHHFGKGLVATPADFGKLGVPPENLELLDWLADEFISQGWSLKRLHRTIMTSQLWMQTRRPQMSDELGPRPYPVEIQVPIQRMSAEAIRDRMLFATGQLSSDLYGAPIDIKEDETGQVVVNGDQTRRSLYIRSQRTRPVAMLQMFDAPVMETNCEVRTVSTVATQSLIMLNGSFILDQAEKLADRVGREAITYSTDDLAAKATLPELPLPVWEYGYGSVDDATGTLASYTKFTHWDGTRWQVGEKVPDPQAGWVFLNADGGHPDQSNRAVIRRWIAPDSGVVTVTGKLAHGSDSGDGVRGRVLSSRNGKLGEWVSHHTTVETPVPQFEVQKGDTIDFITDCREHHNSDSFQWGVTLKLERTGKVVEEFSSKSQFAGPRPTPELIFGQIRQAWLLSLCREPSSEELAVAAGFIAQQLQTLSDKDQSVPQGVSPFQQAMTNLCQTLMISNEFLYVE